MNCAKYFFNFKNVIKLDDLVKPGVIIAPRFLCIIELKRYIVRKHCDLKYKDWRFVLESIRAPLRDKLLVIDKQMQRAWHGHKHNLRKHFVEVGGAGDLTKAKTEPHEEVSQVDWEYLCDSWSTCEYLAWEIVCSLSSTCFVWRLGRLFAA
ncbi:unnamed protein product [Cuscuta europaea]|uniref:Uncharacterized protein n=1 Tax=Cuscuta europaea TaxID=41803 RepID=A0A9P0YMG1_CUSEU|nr:unnamed protein product [Cuscuta europaea]